MLLLVLFEVIHMPQNVNNNWLRLSQYHAPFGFPFRSHKTPDAKKMKVTKFMHFYFLISSVFVCNVLNRNLMTLQPGHCLSMYSGNCNKDYVHDFARCNDVLLVHNGYLPLLSYHHLKMCFCCVELSCWNCSLASFGSLRCLDSWISFQRCQVYLTWIEEERCFFNEGKLF